jgi:hypothetical protein
MDMKAVVAELQTLNGKMDEILELLKVRLAPLGVQAPVRTDLLSVGGNDGLSLQAEFFRKIVEIYIQVYERKERLGLKWAAGRTVARQSAEAVADFIRTHLEVDVPDVEVNVRDVTGRDPVYVVVSRRGEDKPRAVVRYWPDLGYRRGEAWYEELDPLVRTECDELGAAPNQVLLLVCTMLNSLSHEHIKTILGDDAPKPGELCRPEHREELRRYLAEYVGGVDPSVIPNPQRQFFFLAADIHPRDPDMWGEDARYLSPEYQDQWLSPSMPEMLDRLRQMCQ